MQLKVLLFFLLLAFVRSEQDVKEDECDVEKAGECIENLLVTVLSDESEEDICKVLNGMSQCLDETADECFKDNKGPMIEVTLREMRRIVAANCPPADAETPDEISQCLDRIEDETMECVTDDEPPEDIKCSVYESVIRCIVKKVEDSCGKLAAQYSLEEFLDIFGEKENCQLPDARDFL